MEEDKKFETEENNSSENNGLDNPIQEGVETPEPSKVDIAQSISEESKTEEKVQAEEEEPKAEENIQAENEEPKAEESIQTEVKVPEQEHTTPPVHLEKPAVENQPPINNQPMGYNGQPMGYNGQPMNGNPSGFYGQPMNGQPMGYNGQSMNGQQMGYNGQPMNGNPSGFYGQPNIQNPPNYQQGFMPIQPQNPKKGKTGLVIGIVAAVVVLVIAAGILISKSSLFGGNAKKRLNEGMVKMVQEMAVYNSAISEDIGLVELAKLKKESPIHTNMDLSFTDPTASGSLDNIGIEIDSITDFKNKMAECAVSIGTYGLNMEIGEIIAADNILYFSIPLLFQNDVYSLDLTNLGKDFNQSEWSDLLETTLPEDYSYTLFDISDSLDSLQGSELDADFVELMKKYNTIIEDATEYTTISEKKKFDIGGTTVSCDGVRVSVDKDAYNEMMENLKKDILASDFYASFLTGYLNGNTSYDGDYEDLRQQADEIVETIFSMRFEQDYVTDYYLDAKGRIVNISTPADIAVSSDKYQVDAIAIDISFTGVERALDEIEGGIYINTGNNVGYLGIQRQASVTEEVYSENLSVMLQDDSHINDVAIEFSNDWNYKDKSFDMWIAVDTLDNFAELEVDGDYTNIVKGEGYTFRVKNAALRFDDEDVLLFSGTMKTEPTDETIEVPQDAIDLLKMSMKEIENMVYQAIGSMRY